MSYKLSDEVLAAIAQSLQLAMLTGTDIVDHLRLIEVEPGTEDSLVISASSRERIQKNIEDLLTRAKELHAARAATTSVSS